MTAIYNNNGRTARYVCHRMHADYGEPFCQSLKAAPLDVMMARLVLQALEPAAVEASLLVANDLEAERAALEHHWQQRQERAGYVVERARRQYDAVEPENRLVARTLERAWEQALAAQSQLAAEYDHFRRERLKAPGAAEMAMIRSMAQDLPRSGTVKPPPRPIVRPLCDCCSNGSWSRSSMPASRCVWNATGRAALGQPTR